MNLDLSNPFGGIRKAFDDPAKYVIMVAGRRTGKTHEAVDWLIKENLEGAETTLWVDTVQVNIDKYIDRYWKPRLAGLWKYCKWNAQKKILTMPTGSYIDFASAQKPENLEGFEYDRMILNEAGIILKKPALWDNTLQPMTKGKKNKTRIIGTPKGRGKFHELSVLGNSDDERYRSFHFSAYDSPFWTEEELVEVQRNIPSEAWRQEYMAEFLEGAGVVFRNIGNCIAKGELGSGESGGRYVMGVDLAKHRDFTVIMVADIEKKAVIYMDRFNQIDWTFQKRRIAEVSKKFNRAKIILDSTGVGDSIYDDLLAMGITVEGYKFTSTSKKDLIQNLSVAIDNVDLTFHPWEILMSELEVFGFEMSAAGNLRYSAPEGLHDDAVIALGLVNYGLKSNREFSFVSNY